MVSSEQPTAENAVKDDLKELQYRRQAETKTTNRRAVLLDPENTDVFKHRSDKHNALHHDHLGLIGSLRYWAAGSPIKAKELLVDLIRHADLE